MRFKLFFLGMFAAAFLISCNNAIVEDLDAKGGIGQSTTATFTLNFKNPATYAGETVVNAAGYETAVSNAAVYVYRWDGANTTPEQMAFIPSTAFSTTGAQTKQVTLMVKNGEKKIFVAVNIGPNTSTNPLVNNNNQTFTHTLKLDTGVLYSTSLSGLNWIIQSAPAGYTTMASLPAAPTPTVGGSAGLIQTLAGGSMVPADGYLYQPASLTVPDRFCLMTNWDGDRNGNPADVNSAVTYLSNCWIDLLPNIDIATSKTPGHQNNIVIGVQRAYAKISLRITANGTGVNNADTYVGPYESSQADGSKGRFTPWTVGTPGVSIWSLGGINKRTYPFQSFAGTMNAVASPNFLLSYGDIIDTAAIRAGTTPNSQKWYDSYDNTRVFANRDYFTAANTVAAVRSTMTGANNYLQLSLASGTDASMRFAHCTENGTQYPQLQDRSTFVIIGGVYQPQNWLSSLLRAPVTTNPPFKGWNGATAVIDPHPTSPVMNVYGPAYAAVPYPNVVPYVGNDTLYYLVGEKLFIHGSSNLAKYYSWELQLNKDAVTPTINDAAIATVIKNAIAGGSLLCYFQGNCFYRIWVRDQIAGQAPATAHNEILVRRNHIYDVNIVNIKGPGIADPNSIIVPGKPIPEMDTFVTAEINILNWHKVKDDEDVSYE